MRVEPQSAAYGPDVASFEISVWTPAGIYDVTECVTEILEKWDRLKVSELSENVVCV